MVVQARIIKHLLFHQQGGAEGRTLQSLKEVERRDQDEALAAALTDTLWLAGEERTATVALVTEDYCVTPQLDYQLDTWTEKLQLFTFRRREDVLAFVLEHVHCFNQEWSHGVILFLYSLVCSRSISRLKDDLECSSAHLLRLSFGNFVCGQELLNLLLTGRASPHLFNGTQYTGEDGQPLERPLRGVQSRCDVGYLHWSREQTDRGRLPQVGSRLKTPRFPVWLCGINRTFSVLFGLNRSLLSDWRMEHVFQLYYYSGQSSQRVLTRLSIDTHSHHWECCRDAGLDVEKRFPSLEMAIRTKWDGAVIDWNGTAPFY